MISQRGKDTGRLREKTSGCGEREVGESRLRGNGEMEIRANGITSDRPLPLESALFWEGKKKAFGCLTRKGQRLGDRERAGTPMWLGLWDNDHKTSSRCGLAAPLTRKLWNRKKEG